VDDQNIVNSIVGGFVVLVAAALAATYSRRALWTALGVSVSVYVSLMWRQWLPGKYEWFGISGMRMLALVVLGVGLVWIRQQQRGNVRLAAAIRTYDKAIAKAIKRRFTKDAKADLKSVFRQTRDLIAVEIGPVEASSFESAPPVTVTYSLVPEDQMHEWQVARGRIEYLQKIAKEQRK
jgi:hypothetical protein